MVTRLTEMNLFCECNESKKGRYVGNSINYTKISAKGVRCLV